MWKIIYLLFGLALGLAINIASNDVLEISEIKDGKKTVIFHRRLDVKDFQVIEFIPATDGRHYKVEIK